ncbi:hypothetical protein BC941DRAFT_425641 [Chlamydoabsidia padenii]|nr:hypothetical protein BC941DRAFT_425641 [Chlamydoabsidia padenii]
MAKPNPGYSVTDIEDSDEEELFMTLLARALDHSPKTTRGTSTIKEWMAIIEHSEDLKQYFALNNSQQQVLETFAMANPDMELDAHHIRCIYSMVLKSEPLALKVDHSSVASPPPATTVNILKSSISPKKQQPHHFTQRMMDQSPASPTPSLDQQQQQRSRVESSTSRHQDQPEDSSIRFQSKGKKVSIDPTLEHRGTTSEDSDENSRHNSGGNKGASQTLYDLEEGYGRPNVLRLSNITPERLQSHRQNNKLSFQPVDEQWIIQASTQASNSSSTNNEQQQADRNALLLDDRVKDMENEIQALRSKIRGHETTNSQQLQELKELKYHLDSIKQQHRQLDQKRTDEIDELKMTIKELRSELDTSQLGLSNANQRCSQLEDSLAKSQSDSNYWKATLEQTRADVTRWKSASERSQNDAAHWKSALDRLENNSASWKTALNQKTDELALLQKDGDHHKATLYKLEAELDQKENELKKTHGRLEELEKVIPPNMTLTKVEESLKKVALLEKDKEISDALIVSTKGKLVKLTTDLEASQDKIRQLELEKQLDQQHSDTAESTKSSTRSLSFWSQWEAITHDKKKLAEQLDTQAKVIERLRSQILSNGSTINQIPTEKQSTRWWLPIIGILGIVFLIAVTGFVYVINSPPSIYGLWNDPHGYQGQWLSDAPMPRSWILLLLDRILLPRDHTFVPPI